MVDAKAPLGAYLEALEAKDEETKSAKLRQHAAQVQAHIRKLAAKSYWEGFVGSTEFVVMFLPGDSFYSVALEQMPGLIEEGVAQKVLLATPTTLLGLLLTTSCGWREERLAENAQRISDEGRALHHRIATVLEYFANLGSSLNQSVKHFNQALVSFNGRVTVSARRLEELDARGQKGTDGDRSEIDVRAASARPLERTIERTGDRAGEGRARARAAADVVGPGARAEQRRDVATSAWTSSSRRARSRSSWSADADTTSGWCARRWRPSAASGSPPPTSKS